MKVNEKAALLRKVSMRSGITIVFNKHFSMVTKLAMALKFKQ
jgi:hypothetical protein